MLLYGVCVEGVVVAGRRQGCTVMFGIIPELHPTLNGDVSA